MPIIEMHMIEGRTVEQKQRVAAAVTTAVAESLDCSQIGRASCRERV